MSDHQLENLLMRFLPVEGSMAKRRLIPIQTPPVQIVVLNHEFLGLRNIQMVTLAL